MLKPEFTGQFKFLTMQESQTVRYESEGICQSAFSIPAWPNDRNQISKRLRILVRSCLTEYNIF